MTPETERLVDEIALRFKGDYIVVKAAMLEYESSRATQNADAPAQGAPTAEQSLIKFAIVCLEAHREHGGNDLDGGFLQDAAEECGVLKEVQVSEPCDPNGCYCAEYYGDDFPNTCLRYADEVRSYMVQAKAIEAKHDQ